MKTDLSENVCRMVDEQGPLTLSEMFLNFWCGKTRPPEELELWLRDRGFEIFPGTDHRGGWKVQRKDSENSDWTLF